MKNSNDRFHLGNLIKKHIYFRNKTVKEVAMHLDLNEKTFSDHLNKPKMLSDELFKIADYLELSLDYIGSMSKNKPGLLGQKVCRLNNNSHKAANELINFEIEKIKLIENKDVNHIITELKKAYNGIGYVIDALLPLEDSCTEIPYQIYVKESKVRGNINSGEYVIWPPFGKQLDYGKELDMEYYERFLNGEDGMSFLKSLLKNSVAYEQNDYINNNGLDLDRIHLDYESVNGEEILQLWNGSRVIKDNNDEIICAKPCGPGRRRFEASEYSRAEYYYVLGMRNLKANKYYDALIDFNTATHIYHNDTIFVNSQFYEGLRKVTTECIGYNPLSIFDLYFGKAKALKKFRLYKSIIKDTLTLIETDDYKELEKEDYASSCSIIIEVNKILLDAYINDKQFNEALTVCDRLLELMGSRSTYNIRIVKALVFEQMEDYNAALEVIADDFRKSTKNDFLKEFQYEYTQINRLGKRLVQAMKDKGIDITVKSFILNTEAEC